MLYFAAVPPTLEYCTCWGDPHCGLYGQSPPEDMIVYGACRHTLASDRCPDAEEPGTFDVIATFQKVKPHMDRSFVKEVLFKFQLADGTECVSIWGYTENSRFSSFIFRKQNSARDRIFNSSKLQPIF